MHYNSLSNTEIHLEKLLQQYSKCSEPISVDFRNMIPDFNFADRVTHLIHTYPAKLLMHIPHFFLSNSTLSKPGDTVLDPFSGSGTVLLESIIAGRRAYGVDINPLARLVSKVKTQPIPSKRLKLAIRSLLRRIPKTPRTNTPDVVNLEYWFPQQTIDKLQCLLEAIRKTRNTDVKDFFLVTFSQCLKKVSYADPRISVPVRLRSNQYDKTHYLHDKVIEHLSELDSVDVISVFSRALETNFKRLLKLNSIITNTNYAQVICSDASKLNFEFSNNGCRNDSIPDNSIQLIITSPPYPGAQKYIRASTFSLGWLGLCSSSNLMDLKRKVIGREEFRKNEYCEKIITGDSDADYLIGKIYEKNKKCAAIASSYILEMKNVLKEQYRVLKKGGYFVLVAANNRICGENFRTQEYLRRVSKDLGFVEQLLLIDDIRSRGLMTKRNATANIISREYIVVFKKI